MPNRNLARPLSDDKEPMSDTEAKNKIIKFEGWAMLAMVGLIGWFANQTLTDIKENIKDIHTQTQSISDNVSQINTKVAVISEDVNNMNSRLTNDEQNGGRFMPAIRSH